MTPSKEKKDKLIHDILKVISDAFPDGLEYYGCRWLTKEIEEQLQKRMFARWEEKDSE